MNAVRRSVKGCAVVLVLALCARAQAGDPTRVWRTLESAHFAVHYPEPLGELAVRVARAAERAHRTLSVVLRHAPREPTDIVLSDDTDSSNGFASVLPRNEIHLFASAPTDVSALNDHDDWIYGLVAHEYTHVLHLDAIGGLPALYNRVFGKTWAPNQIQPRWVIEGLATYEEGKRTSGGRTRHALFDMNLRLATLSGYERRLDEISNGPRAWPHGNAAYLYGGHFLEYVFDRHGDDKAAVMSWAHGQNPVPYGINRSILAATGRTFVDLYDDWRGYRRSRYGLEAEAVARSGRTEGRRLTFTGETNFNPRYTRDGKTLVWQRGDGYSEGQFRAMPVGGDVSQSSTYAIILRTGAFDLLADGSMVVEQTHTHRTQYDFQDLALWDRRTGATTMLTEGARASDPAVSPDERWVAFAMNGGSHRRLALIPLRPDAPIRVLWSGAPYDQAFSPAWSPDGRSIAFSAWRAGGYRDILLLDVGSGAVRELTADRAQDVNPTFSPDGRFVYFSSDRTGIYDVYAHEVATGALFQVTRVLGAAVAPAVSPDGRRLAYHGYGEEGYELFEMALDPASFRRAPPYIDDRPAPVVIRADEAAVSASRPYRPLDTLAPRAYTLQLRQNSFGRALSVTTGGADVVGHHAYDLAASLALDDTNVNLGLGYSYRRLWPTVRLALARTGARRGGFFIDGRSTAYLEETLSSTLSLGLPVLREPTGSATIALDYDLDYVRPLEEPFTAFDPNDELPVIPDAQRQAGLALRASYSNARGYLYTVGPQTGIDVALSGRLNHEALGSQRGAILLNYRLNAYGQIPLPRPVGLSARLAGGLRASGTGAGAFELGGVPQQDVVAALRDDTRVAASGYLRGYPARSAVGDQFHLLNLEWRQELWVIERGLASLPLYARRLHYAGLFDVGHAFRGEIDLAQFRPAVGGALRLDFLLGYFLPGTLEVGYARGLAAGGRGEYWTLLTGTL